MKKYTVQMTVYGFTTIEAESFEDAVNQSEELEQGEFDISHDFDIEVIGESD